MSPNSSRLSQIGTSAPMLPAMCQSGRMGVPVTLNGISDRAWLWHTAITSGRARYAEPWIGRSEYIVWPCESIGRLSRSNSMRSSRSTSSGLRDRARK